MSGRPQTCQTHTHRGECPLHFGGQFRLASIFGLLVGTSSLVSKVMSANIDPLLLPADILSGIYITLAVSLNLINGITGQFSIGHAGFYAVGAYIGAAWTMLAQPHVVKVASDVGARHAGSEMRST